MGPSGGQLYRNDEKTNDSRLKHVDPRQKKHAFLPKAMMLETKNRFPIKSCQLPNQKCRFLDPQKCRQMNFEKIFQLFPTGATRISEVTTNPFRTDFATFFEKRPLGQAEVSTNQFRTDCSSGPHRCTLDPRGHWGLWAP